MTANSSTRPADYDARQQALDPNRSFAVTAPAGSGKTSLLTQRLLTLLALCEQPEQVLAITFTRKAAQEMQHRIISTLHAAQQTPAGSRQASSEHERTMNALADAVLERDTALNWNLLLCPHRLRIQTIDSFCQSLVQQLPLSAGSHALLNTTESPQSLYREAVQNLLLELNRDNESRADLSRLLLHIDTDVGKLEQLLMQLLQSRGQWLWPLLSTKYLSDKAPQHAKDHLSHSLRTVIEENLETFNETLAPHWGQLRESIGYAAVNLYRQQQQNSGKADQALQVLVELGEQRHGDAQNNPGEYFQCTHHCLPYWRAMANLLTTTGNTWRKQLTVNQGFPTSKDKTEKAEYDRQKHNLLDIISQLSTKESALSVIEDVKNLPDADIAAKQWQLLDSLTRLLPRLVAHYDLVCSQRGQCDFNSVTEAALRALGDEDQPSELALKLDYRIQHILVDEFQDTSSVQLELLEKLTAGWQGDDGRTLFIVGDAMQSCYGFRDANVGIFMDARHHGIGSIPLCPLELSVNFRSEPGIVEWVNGSFIEAFPAAENVSRGAVPYTNAVAFHPKPPDQMPSVTIKGFAVEADRLLAREAEAREILEIVQEHLAQSDNKSIAILARNRSHLQTILMTLRRAGIVWQAQDVDPLSQRMAVIDLLSLTRALLDVGDRTAWLSILRAPWCGLSLDDLYQLTNHKDDASEGSGNYPLLWDQLQNWQHLNLSAPGREILQRVVPILCQAVQQQRRKPLRPWLHGTWLALGGPASVTNPDELYSVEQFFDLLEQHRKGSGLDWPAFNQALDRLYDQSSQASRLQVMTIHKAKGLEFDTVIIPGLSRPPRHDDNALLLWQHFLDREGDQHVLLSPLQQTGEAEDSIYRYLKREQSIRNQLEATRLLYIGCTRAVSRLYLLTQVQPTQVQPTRVQGGSRAVAFEPDNKRALINAIWPAISAQADIVPTAEQGADSGDAGTAPQQLHHILRLRGDWSAPQLRVDPTLQTYRPPASYEDNQAPEPEATGQRQARQLGTVLHGVLQYITLSGGCDQWDSHRVDRHRAQWQGQLRTLGFSGAALEQGINKLVDSVNACLNDPTGRWLLDHNHPQSACEMEVLATVGHHRAPDGGATQSSHAQSSYILDRTFIDGDTRWIVDYKSSQPAIGQSLEAFLYREVEQYRPQLSTYAELMQELDPRVRIKTALYFPLLPLLKPVHDLPATSS